MLRSIFFPAVFCLGSILLSAQDASKDDTFTLIVDGATRANDVQVRYIFNGGSGGHVSSVATPTKDNRILIKTAAEDKLATSFRLVAFAPGCEFVTISVEDLSSSRQAEFRCRPMSSVQFNGQLNADALSSNTSLRVQVLYNCDWCPQFFGMSAGALSPLVVGKADVGSNGSFLIDLPDFSADPQWSSGGSDASLSFYLVDLTVDEMLGPLTPLMPKGELVNNRALHVAASYPLVDFNLQPQRAAASGH